jgi:hypothetical protein
LTLVQTAQIDTGGGGGFFTAVSSDGDKNVIIWAVSRRHSKDGGPEPTLYAFAPVPGNPQFQQIFKAQAGNWDVPHPPGDGANSNIVPVVANGHVYVASYKRLDIFGFVGPVVEIATSSESESKLTPRFGVITKVEGSSFVMKTETGKKFTLTQKRPSKTALALRWPATKECLCTGLPTSTAYCARKSYDRHIIRVAIDRFAAESSLAQQSRFRIIGSVGESS